MSDPDAELVRDGVAFRGTSPGSTTDADLSAWIADGWEYRSGPQGAGRLHEEDCHEQPIDRHDHLGRV